jgi:saccharopine dehydrogenase-like NADP-dependent oxidoreductase
MKVAVLGGYGNFGARIARALADDEHIDLIVAARDLARARCFAQSLGSRVTAACIDINKPDLADQLVNVGARLVIHTAGPFQEQNWHVPQSSARAGAHYIDLADGRRWVCDFPAALNLLFTNHSRIAFSGASTVPALSSAVIDTLTKRLARMDKIDICIAPAQKAPRGVATLRAVLSYCGEPVRLWRDGAWTSEVGWSNPEWIEFARMRPRRGALCDIPDLELFPARYPGCREVMFRAALEVGATQQAFALLAALRVRRLLPPLARLAPLLHRVAVLFDRLGSPLGGMVVRVSGIDGQAQPRRYAWHLTADHHHGPEIPCMAAIVLARRLARGDALRTGAFACMGFVSLVEFEQEFSRWGMVSEMLEE